MTSSSDGPMRGSLRHVGRLSNSPRAARIKYEEIDPWGHLVTLDYTCATGLLVVTSQVTAVTAPASRLRPIDVSHVHPGGQSSVSSSVGPLQVPGRDQPVHAR